MTSEPIQQSLRLSVAGIMLIVTATAIVLWLGRLWEKGAGIYAAIAVCAVPFSILVEFAFGQSAKREPVGWKKWLARVGLLLLCSIVPAIASMIGIWNSMVWWSPAPWLTMIWYSWIYEFLVSFDGSFALTFFTPPAILFFVTLTAPVIANKSLVNLPLRSLVMLLIATMTSVYWFGASFSDIEKYQSHYYVTMSIVSNALVIVALWASWFFLRNRFNTAGIILWNMALVSWLFWIAHPWLGEYP